MIVFCCRRQRTIIIHHVSLLVAYRCNKTFLISMRQSSFNKKNIERCYTSLEVSITCYIRKQKSCTKILKDRKKINHVTMTLIDSCTWRQMCFFMFRLLIFFLAHPVRSILEILYFRFDTTSMYNGIYTDV